MSASLPGCNRFRDSDNSRNAVRATATCGDAACTAITALPAEDEGDSVTAAAAAGSCLALSSAFTMAGRVLGSKEPRRGSVSAHSRDQNRGLVKPWQTDIGMGA